MKAYRNSFISSHYLTQAKAKYSILSMLFFHSLKMWLMYHPHKNLLGANPFGMLLLALGCAYRCNVKMTIKATASKGPHSMRCIKELRRNCRRRTQEDQPIALCSSKLGPTKDSSWANCKVKYPSFHLWKHNVNENSRSV